MHVHDEAGCNAAAASCRASLDPAEVGSACQDVIDMTGCSVTVADYFRCLDDWYGDFVCADAGIYIPMPESCKPVDACHLSNQGSQSFMQIGRPAPCSPDSPPRPPDTNDDIYGLDDCPPIPQRMVALGDSVVSCSETSPACAPLLLANYIRDHYSPSLAYENQAEANSSFVDNLHQAQRVNGGPGHIVVWMFAFPADVHSEAYDLWQAQLASIFDYFTDVSRFPDGATFLLNTQYSPSDQCPNPPPTLLADPLSMADEQLLQRINQRIFIASAEARSDTVTVDQYPDWLGHGSNANARGCPYCSSDDNTLWLADHVHPNEAGQRHIFDKWRVAVDRMYGGSCRN